MKIITVDPVLFRERYPEFKDCSDIQIEDAYDMSTAYISNKEGQVSGWNLKTHAKALYLATAHQLFLRNNPAVLKGGGNAQIQSASEGSDSVGFKLNDTKNNLEYFLNLSIYGLELLVLLDMTAPPLPTKPFNDAYYP
jgi:hypothetical protein